MEHPAQAVEEVLAVGAEGEIWWKITSTVEVGMKDQLSWVHFRRAVLTVCVECHEALIYQIVRGGCEGDAIGDFLLWTFRLRVQKSYPNNRMQ